MKKIYLSSYNIPTPDKLIELLTVPVEQAKIGIIINAKDSYPSEVRLQKIEKTRNVIDVVGFQHIYIIDLDLTQDTDELNTQLKDLDILWVAGGNTFYLRYAMKKSGFERIIKQLIEDGLVYAGDSAGAIVAGPTLYGVDLIDDTDSVPELILDGLHIIDYTVIPHVGGEFIGDLVQEFSKLYKDDVKIELTDHQAVTIIGNEVTYGTNES